MSDLSLQQQVESLWGDAQQRVYAVVRGARVPGLRQRLAEADVDDWDALWSGELEPEELEAAPHLVGLTRGAAFATWLEAEAAKAYPDWGLFLVSSRPFVPLRTHGRALCRATDSEGRELRLDWADPAVLLALLPLAPPPQLAQVFAGFTQIVLAGAQAWTRVAAPMGRLSITRSGVIDGPVAA